MISASGSNPLERAGEGALILPVIRLMNDPGPEALADPTLIMLHLGGTGGRLANRGEDASGELRSASRRRGQLGGRTLESDAV